MSKGVWQTTIVDNQGNVLPFASVTFRYTNGTLANLYSNSTGTPLVGNPQTADANGFIRVYLDPGVAHNITATSGANQKVWLDVVVSIEFTVDFAAAILAASSKSTPIDADKIPLVDSAASNVLKYLTWANLKATLALITGCTIQVFSAAGAATYTPTAGMKFCIALATGAGAGGGGADTAGGSADIGVGSGGGAGATVIKAFTAAQIGASQAVSVGTGGTAGSATNGTDGGAGGNTTLGTAGALLSATGCTGVGVGSGAAAADIQANLGGTGATASGGTVNINGGSGDGAFGFSVDTTADTTVGMSGSGGASFWGGGGKAAVGVQTTLTTDVNVAGQDGQAPGSGGSGAVCLNSTTGAAGGAGKTGILVIIEFT